MINVGNLAKMYHLLPSQVIANATTFDLMITDVLTTWEDSKTNPGKMENYRVEDLQQRLKESRQ